MNETGQIFARPKIIEDAQARRPRRKPTIVTSTAARSAASACGTPFAPAPQADGSHIKKSHNNYIAEARAMRRPNQTSPLGGRNRKGAGAPRGNHNALGSHLFHAVRRGQKHRLQQCFHIVVLKAAVAHAEIYGAQSAARRVPVSLARVMQSPPVSQTKKLHNNYIAEARAMRGTAQERSPALLSPHRLC